MPINGVSAAMRERVSQQLKEIERRYGVKVLYACESGSRGWGFASPDSDYDVRFLYVHPLEWYLRVEAPRDVIELPIDDELDVSGWEWRKALGLLKGANPTLIEWLDSPVVYQQDEETITPLTPTVALPPLLAVVELPVRVPALFHRKVLESGPPASPIQKSR